MASEDKTKPDCADYANHMQRIIIDTCEHCLSLVTTIVEQVADAAAASSGENMFTVDAWLLQYLLDNLPEMIDAAKQAAQAEAEDCPRLGS